MASASDYETMVTTLSNANQTARKRLSNAVSAFTEARGQLNACVTGLDAMITALQADAAAAREDAGLQSLIARVRALQTESAAIIADADAKAAAVAE